MKVTATTPPSDITLSVALSPREARVLQEIFSLVGGIPTGPCSVAQAIYDALEERGVRLTAIGKGFITLPDSWEAFEA